jgi:acetyl esterase/lipase
MEPNYEVDHINQINRCPMTTTRWKTTQTVGCLIAGCLASIAILQPEAAGTAEQAPAKIVYLEDVAYGRLNGAGLLADIAYPESKEPLPAIISVHGGRWVGGHKRDASTIKVEQWAGFGFFAMSIDYRLKYCTPAPACYQDFQCANRYVHAHAKKFNVDPNRIFLIGQSAGGHMVSLAATLGDGPYPRTGGWEKESNDFRAAISVAAAYDFVALDWGALWTPPGVPVDEARALASPTKHVTKTSKPLLILHSDNDRSVPIDNALTMIDVLKKAEARHTFHRYPEMGHMGINDEVIKQSLAFIKEVSAKPVDEKGP